MEEGGVRPRGMVGVGGVPPKKEEKDRVKGKGVTDRLWSVGPGCRVGDRDGGGGLVGGGVLWTVSYTAVLSRAPLGSGVLDQPL